MQKTLNSVNQRCTFKCITDLKFEENVIIAPSDL